MRGKEGRPAHFIVLQISVSDDNTNYDDNDENDHGSLSAWWPIPIIMLIEIEWAVPISISSNLSSLTHLTSRTHSRPGRDAFCLWKAELKYAKCKFSRVIFIYIFASFNAGYYFVTEYRGERFKIRLFLGERRKFYDKGCGKSSGDSISFLKIVQIWIKYVSW